MLNKKILFIYYVLIVPLLIVRLFSQPLSEEEHQPKTLTGLDVLVQSNFKALNGMKVGIITNQTAVNRNGKHIVDLFYQAANAQVAALFGPEHGIRGTTEGGARIAIETEVKKNIPIYSLYGESLKPTPEMLAGLDALVFDIQDVGTRFYTYISTLSKAMEAAAEQGIEFFVLDRPNPIGGMGVEGPVLRAPYQSFVGIHPIALRHGMTIGELARMFNAEGWLKNAIRVKLTVIQMENWQRADDFKSTGLVWIRPSPNMPTPMTAWLYPGIGLLEATNVSEGRGTSYPFEYIGAPWIKSHELAQYLGSFHLPGIAFESIQFTPKDIPGMATHPKYHGQVCNGLKLVVSQPAEFQTAQFGIFLLSALRSLYPDSFIVNQDRMNKLAGVPEVYEGLRQAKAPFEIIACWQEELASFKKMREKYLLY